MSSSASTIQLPIKPQPPKFILGGYLQAPTSTEGKIVYDTSKFVTFGALVGLSKFYYQPHKTTHYYEVIHFSQLVKKYINYMKFPMLQGATIGLFYAGAYHGIYDIVNRGEELSPRQYFLTGLATGAGIGLATTCAKKGAISALLLASAMSIINLLQEKDKHNINTTPLEEYRKARSVLYMTGKQPSDVSTLLKSDPSEKLIYRHE